METLIKCAVIGVVAAVISLLLKKTSPEMALIITSAAAIAILTMVTGIFGELTGLIQELADISGLSPSLTQPVMKCVGISIICRLSSDVCKDAGAASASSAIELAGGLTCIAVSVPLIRAVLAAVENVI